MLGYQRTPMYGCDGPLQYIEVISPYPVLRLTTLILQENVCPPSYPRAAIIGRKTSAKIKAGTGKVA
jgi:hypothetical protein